MRTLITPAVKKNFTTVDSSSTALFLFLLRCYQPICNNSSVFRCSSMIYYLPSLDVKSRIARSNPRVDPLLDRSMNANLCWISFESTKISPSSLHPFLKRELHPKPISGKLLARWSLISAGTKSKLSFDEDIHHEQTKLRIRSRKSKETGTKPEFISFNRFSEKISFQCAQNRL